MLCLGLNLIPYASTSLKSGSGTVWPNASLPAKLSISLLLKSSGISLLLSCSLISFHAVCFCPTGFKFLLKLICKFCSSSLSNGAILLNTIALSLTKLINGSPAPIGSARYFANVNVSYSLPRSSIDMLSSSALFCTQ